MTRRAIFIFLILILAVVANAGFFISHKILAAENKILFNDGNLLTSNGWQCGDCLQKESSGNYFIVASSSQFQLVSSEIDLSQYVSSTLNFKSRTYYGTSTEHYRIDLSVSSDGGSSWSTKQSFYPQNNNFEDNIFSYDLNEFKNQKILVKLTAPGVIGRNSVGFDDLFFVATLPTINQNPVAIASISTSTAMINEEIFFDGSQSYDGDGSIADWIWDLAGELIHASTTSKSFGNAGNKVVYFWAIDNEGASSSLAFNLNITEQSSTSTVTSSSKIINPNDLVINEVYPAPPTGEAEWLEIYNNTTSTIDLSGLYLLDAKFSTTTISGSIDAGGYLIIENISGNLNNDGDTVILRNQDLIISQTTYGDFSNKKDQSWSRDLSGQYWPTIKITRGAANIIEAKPVIVGGGSSYTPNIPPNKITTSTISSTTQVTSSLAINYHGKIIINEIYPNPSGTDNEEFIELKNISNQDIELNGFYLSDNTNTKHLIKSSDKLIVLAGGLIIIKRASSSIALNNSGFEAINLYDPEGDMIDRVTYEAEKSEGRVYARNDSGEWLWSLSPTPGEENIFNDSQELIATVATIVSKAKTTSKKIVNSYGLVELDKVNELADGSKVIIRGLVSVEPGLLGVQVFYIAGSGIQVYCYKKDFPNLKIGDYIEITGELSTASTGRRIKIKNQNDIKILDHREPPLPHELPIGEIGEDYENNLVKTEGEIIQIKGRSIFIDDGEEELEVYVKSSINLKDLNLKDGDKLGVVGIIVKGGSNHRLLPRTLADFNVSRGQVMGEFEGVENKTKTNQLTYYLLAVIVFLVGLIIFLYLKLNKKY